MFSLEEQDEMVTVGFRMPADTKDRVIELSKQHGRSLSAVLRSLIHAGLQVVDKQ